METIYIIYKYMPSTITLKQSIIKIISNLIDTCVDTGNIKKIWACY